MKTVTTQYLERLKDSVAGRNAKVKIRYKRRYWNGSAYVYEASFQDLSDSFVESITPIVWKMDVKSQNRILASNVSLRLKNEDWFWVRENINGGAFAPDNVAVDGYDDYRIMFQIQHGVQLDDGTYEYLALFTGYSSDIVYTTDKLSAEIRILGRELQLAEANAQNVSNVYTNQAAVPATGNGVNLLFRTLASVWEISRVRVAAAIKSQGTQYKLSDMNTPDIAALITFEAAAVPLGGQAVDWTGRQWLQNKTIQDLIGRLCDEAGITPGERTITPPTFPAIDQSYVIDDEPQWSAATKTHVDTTSEPGKLKQEWYLMDNFQDGNSSVNPSWVSPFTVSGQRGRIGNFVQQARIPHSKVSGTWEWSMAGIFGGDNGYVDFIFMSDSGNGFVANGYAVRWAPFGGASNLKLIKYTAGGAAVLGTATYASGSLTDRFAVSRTVAGLMKVSVNGSLMITATDNTHTVAGFFTLHGRQSGLGANLINWGDLYYSNIVQTAALVLDYLFYPVAPQPTMRWESNEIDLLAAPSVWLPMVITEVLNGGARTIKTKTATISGGPYDAEVAIDGSNIPTSALKRYIKIIIEMTPNATNNSLVGVEFDGIILRWQGSELFIGQADFKGKSCLTAIQRLAEIVDCEFGFNGDGTFFFRPKDVSPSAVLDLSQHNFVVGIGSLVRGFDAVSNVVTVSYGQYYNETNALTQGDASPNSQDRFGEQILAKTVNDFLFANNADFAGAMAQILYQSRKEPQVRIVADARIIPPLNLSDVINFGFSDRPTRENNYFGDPQNPDPVFGEDFRMILRTRLFKVLGITYNINDGKNTLELIEVLS